MSKQNVMAEQDNPLGRFAVSLHLGLMIFGIAAWLSGPLAGDYKKIEHTGFTVHGWIGMALAAIVVMRLVTGSVGPRSVRFSCWMPFTKERIKLVFEDIAGLMKMRLPHRPTHQGLAGAAHTFGLAVFVLMAVSGVFLYFMIEPGHKARGLTHGIKELHEIGMALIFLFLSLHIGAVVMHALHGRDLWRKMLFMSGVTGQETPPAAADTEKP